MCSVVEFLLNTFCHRRDAYCVMEQHKWQTKKGRLRGNYYDRVYEPITEDVIKKHLNGHITISVFPTDIPTQTVRFICWDIDNDDPEIFEKARSLARYAQDTIGHGKIMLEESGTIGRYHVWLLFDKPIDLKYARSFLQDRRSEGIDSFPEKDYVINDYYYELSIKLPLGFHRVAKRYSKFVDENLNPIDINSIL